jgi:hypothetical protein
MNIMRWYVLEVCSRSDQCNPPERVAREVVEMPPMHAFIQHLLHDVLMKRTLDKVLKLVRKLHWDDSEVSGGSAQVHVLQPSSTLADIRLRLAVVHRDLGDQVWQHSICRGTGV